MRRIFLPAVRDIGFAEHPRKLQHRGLLPEILRREDRDLILHRFLCQDGQDPLSLRSGIPFYSLYLRRVNAVSGQDALQEALTDGVQGQRG